MDWGIHDHRTVPVEVLREFVRSQAELSSIRHVGEDAGVSRSTVHKFITAGTMPHPRVRRLLGRWYLRRVGEVDELELLRPYLRALEGLFGDLPESSRGRAILSVLDDVERAYADAEVETPPWVNVLRKRLTQST